MGAKDISGKYYAKEMVEAVKASETGEAYISYYWPKEAGGEALLKTSYCKYVESIDRIIGTGVYFEDLEAIVQEEIYKRFQAYYEGKKEYIFVVNYDGIAKVFGDNSMIGKDVRIFKDIDGNPVFDEVMKIVRNEGSGFLTYHFYERDNDKRSRKISYVKGLDHWNVYIGLGFYLDDFYEDTEVYNDKSLEELQLHLIVFIAVFILLMGTAIYFNVKTIDMSKKYFRQEEMLYEKFSNLTTEGILIIDDNDIIHFANPVAMSILQISKEDFGAFKRSQFIASENGTNKVTGFKGRRTFVEMYSDNIFYQEKDYTVLFLSDITEILKYQESLKLTAATDQLTGLSNRRKYIEDFHEGLDKMIEKNMPFSMGLIDLDKFKCVNDTHGHNVGDEVLKTFSKLVRDAIRDHDELYRYGGEEFTIIMLETELKDGKKLLERINKRLQEYEWVQDGLSVSFTAGLIEIDVKNPRELDFYLKKMDILLYKGKKKGRKRVEID